MWGLRTEQAGWKWAGPWWRAVAWSTIGCSGASTGVQQMLTTHYYPPSLSVWALLSTIQSKRRAELGTGEMIWKVSNPRNLQGFLKQLSWRGPASKTQYSPRFGDCSLKKTTMAIPPRTTANKSVVTPTFWPFLIHAKDPATISKPIDMPQACCCSRSVWTMLLDK